MFTVPSGWFAARATLLALTWTSGAFLKLEVSDVAAGFAPVEAGDSFVGCAEDAGDVVVVAGDSAVGLVTEVDGVSLAPWPIAVLPLSIVVPSLRPFVKLSLL